MISVLKEFLILIVASVVFSFLFIVGIIYTFLKHILKWDYAVKKQLLPIIRSVSLALDGLACASAGELLNDTLKVKGPVKYGKWYQTISAITGLIHKYEKDTWLRRFLDKALGKNHCSESISIQDSFFYDNNKFN